MTNQVVNGTTSALYSLGSLFKNFRRTAYGSVISGFLLVVYKISRWIGISTQEQNYVPMRWFVYIVGFIVLSWIIGTILDKTKIIDKIEGKLK